MRARVPACLAGPAAEAVALGPQGGLRAVGDPMHWKMHEQGAQVTVKPPLVRQKSRNCNNHS
jgi:hypothetical protein